MKKHVTTLCAVWLAVILSLASLAGCTFQPVVKGITVVGGYQEKYYVDDTFPYDDVNILVTYDDGTTATHTAKYLGATHTEADMSTAGAKVVVFTYSGYESNASFVVEERAPEVPVFDHEVLTFSAPEFYTNYLNVSQRVGTTDADFKVANRIYEVGTDNKFLFQPVITYFDDGELETTNANVKTTAKFYTKAAADGEYQEVTGAGEIEQLVANDGNNGYAFTNASVGKFVKMEVSLDETFYTQIHENVPSTTLTCEFQVVNGYNAYDQMGLSVMDDLVSTWAEVKGETQLAADSKKLKEYTDVTNVILHGNITLNPNMFPSEYFYTEATPNYKDVRDTKLAGNGVGLEGKVNGSLRDYYYFDADRDGYLDTDGSFFLSDGGQRVNGQKGLFNTSKCSISGNYNSINVITENSRDMSPSEYQTKYGSRNLYSVYANGGTGETAGNSNPVSHWSLFKFFKKNYDVAGTPDAEMSIKNLACSGSMGHAESNGGPAGIMMVNSYVDKLTIDNVIGDRFYTNFVCDGAGDNSENSKVKSVTNISNTKLLNAYSNMIYTWRGTVNVENSVLRDAGGPLFLMVDGMRQAAIGDQGCVVTVDANTELASYAMGTESWYKQWGATALLGAMKTNDERLRESFGKTMQFVKGANDVATPWDGKSGDSTYLNIIAVMMPSPSELMKTHTPEWLCAGEFITLDAAGEVSNEFVMRTDEVDTVNNYNDYGTALFQSGNNFAIHAGTYLANDTMTGLANATAWGNSSTDLLCTYMSVSNLGKSTDTPYFGVITGFANMSQPQA